jgi:CHAT domain-containing protein
LRAQRLIIIALAVSATILFVLPATGGRSSTPAPYGLYAKNQQLAAKYYRELRFDEARQAALIAYDEARISLTPERVTRPLASLCAVETAMYHYREAAQVCLNAQQQAERFRDADMIWLSAFHLSNLYFHLGAIGEAEAAMERAREVGSVKSDIISQASVLHHEARLAARLESPQRAMPLFVKAADSAFAAGSPATAGQIWDSAAHEFFQTGDMDETERLATEAFRIRRLLDPAQLSSSMLMFSELRLKQGRDAEALRFAEQAFLLRGETRQPLFSFYLDRGMALYALGRLAEARPDLEEAARGVRALRLTMAPADSLRQGAATRQQDVFQSLSNLYGDLFLETGRREFADNGFAVAAEGRAYAFRETSGELSRIREHLNQAYFTTLKEHRQAEEALFVHNTEQGKRTLAALRLRLTELELAAGLDTPSAVDNQWHLKQKPGHALLHFSLGDNRSLLWTVNGDHVGLIVLPDASKIERAARDFRKGLEDNTLAPEAGRQLHALLFSSLPPAIRKTHDWRIVADGELSQIPFAALEDQNGRFLMEDHSLLMVPHAFDDNSVEGATWTGPATAFGDPVYNPADGRQPNRHWTLNPNAPWLPRLPGTAREIRACSRLWGPQPKVYTGADVDLDQIQSSLKSQPALLHFAMHMVPGPNNPAETRLALAVESNGAPRFLDPATIASMNVHSRLVVLSGCRAGSGASVPGEGIAGLGRAWLLAGAGNVAATLWPIDDDSGELFQAFYRALGPQPPEEAMRQAQLAMLHSGSWRAQPRYWGAYFVMGRA